MEQNGSPPVAHAEPSKTFFIDMLTRDIALSVCVLDLIDNSIHSLIEESGIDVSQNLITGATGPRAKAQIEINCSPSTFRISDNCGGVSVKEAEEQVFLFGSSSPSKTQAGLGFYGIGMKRAFFKLGKQISFESHTQKEELRIDIDVDAWSKTSLWEFPFTYARPKTSSSGGTQIEITSLHEVVSQQFDSKAFKRILLEKVSRAYALFVKAGLKIKINGDDAVAEIPDISQAKDLRPVRQLIKKDGVDILIMAGLSPADDKTPRGWYVFCNGRMVLDADKTERSGWGVESHPSFQPKFNHFIGYVYFHSKNLRSLPWSTTKDDVDRESPVYQRALTEMWLLGRPILDFLNALYDDAKEQSEPEHKLFRTGKPLAPQKLASGPNTVWRANFKKGSDDALVSIQYKRPKGKLTKVKEALGRSKMSASRIGEYTFDWFYERNCK